MWGELNTGDPEGGFMDESYTTTAQQSQNYGAKNKLNKAIVPVMIDRLLHETPQSSMQYGTTAVSSLRIVAIVKKMTRVANKIAYELEDETVHLWLGYDGETSEDVDNIKVPKYAVVHGLLRENKEESRQK